MKEGWICPRCGKVNAPFIPSCDCEPKKFSNAEDRCWCGGRHEWVRLPDKEGITVAHGFKCNKCGNYKWECPTEFIGFN